MLAVDKASGGNVAAIDPGTISLEPPLAYVGSKAQAVHGNCQRGNAARVKITSGRTARVDCDCKDLKTAAVATLQQQIDLLEVQEQEPFPMAAKMRQMGFENPVFETKAVHGKGTD